MNACVRKKAAAVLMMLSLMAAACRPAWAASDTIIPVTVEGTRIDRYAEEVLDLMNEQRRENGLEPLSFDSELQKIALQRAAEISTYFSHTRPDGRSCITISARMAGENIAIGYPSPALVMDGWMNSQAHRDSILKAEYHSVGIACISYRGVCHWVQTFGCFTGDGELAENGLGEKQTVDMLAGLIIPEYAGSMSISLNSEESSDSRQAWCSSTNMEWNHGKFLLDPSLLIYSSSDPSVLSVDDGGHMIPKKVGDAVLTIRLKADPSRSVTQEIQVNSTITPEMITLSQTSYTYNGKAREPEVTVKGVPEENYIVSYKNNVKAGTASVIVEGVGDVTGKVEKTFQIRYKRPARVMLNALSAGAGHSVKVRWKKTECDGYQIRYSTSKTFSTYKTVYVENGDAVSKSIKSLTKGKRYYIKARAWNLYEGKRVYGSFSTWRSVICR